MQLKWSCFGDHCHNVHPPYNSQKETKNVDFIFEILRSQYINKHDKDDKKLLELHSFAQQHTLV